MARLLLSFLGMIASLGCTLISVPASQPPTVVLDIEPQPCMVPPGSPALAREVDFSAYGAGIEAYLSVGGSVSDLEADLRANALIQSASPDAQLTQGGGVWQADVTGDGAEDVVVNLHNTLFDPAVPPRDVVGSVIWVFACEDETYRQVAEIRSDGLSMRPYAEGVNVGYVGDVTGDGVAEILYHEGNCGAHTCFISPRVMSWADNALVNLLQPTDLGFPQGSYQVLENPNGADQIEFVTGFIGSVGAGPQRSETWLYGWDDNTFREIEVTAEPPQYTFQAVYDGVRQLGNGNHDAALVSFDLAMNGTLEPAFSMIDSTPQSAQITVQSAARFGALVAYAARDGISADTTQTAFDDLQAQPDNLWLGYGATFYQTALENDLAVACNAVRSEMDATARRQDNADFFVPAYWPDAGYANLPPEPEAVCPF